MKFWYRIIIIFSLLLFTQILAPFLKEGMFLGHDSQLHSIYLRKFEEALRAGQFPVRWIDWFVPGFNQPLFNFYQPGIYYLFQIPRSLGLDYIPSLNVSAVFLWFISALLMFLFAKRHFGTLPGILSSFLYFLAPYHILDIFVRSALPEFTALAFVPGIFWGIKAYFDSSKGLYLTLASFFVALVTISHPPTIIMFSPLILAYITYLYLLYKSFRQILPVIFSLFVGFGLVSFFLIPAYFEQDYVQIVYMHSGYYDFHHHFVCLQQLFTPSWNYGTSQTGCTDKISFQLGIVHWLAVFILAAIICAKFWAGKKLAFISNFVNLENFNLREYWLLLIFLATLFTSVYIMLPISQPIWETLPYIPFIQYSWRFLAVATFTSSFIAGSILIAFKNDTSRYIVFVCLMVAATYAYGGYLKPAAYGNSNEVDFGYKILHPSENLKNFDPEPGYMPRWTDVLPAESDRPKEEVKILLGEAKIIDYKLTASLKKYNMEMQKPSVARFFTHYYPGWKVFVDSKEAQPNYDNIYGFMDIQLPPGKHEVILNLENTTLRSVSNILSINFFIVSLSFIFLYRKKTK
ncbi:hypothetical protein HYW46_01055 [Candidatus Daviesbacteria bacterium]|nr:hypothetical protein [Candidatus Daviesbacteria bacterium]